MSNPVDCPFPGLAFLDGQVVVRRASAQFAGFFGVTPRELVGRDFAALFGEDAASVLRGRCRALLAGGTGGFVDRVPLGHHDAAPALVEVVLAEFDGVLVASLRALAPSGCGDLKLDELDARILEAIARGESTVRIANHLFLSRQGINYRIGNMLRRFQAVNRTELVSRAFSAGVLDTRVWPPRVPAHLVG